MIKGVLINPKTGASVIDIDPDNGIKDYYKYLECDIFDIASRKIGYKNDKYFDIYCDDEGLLKSMPIPGAICGDDMSFLAGNLIVVDHDDEGNTISITDEEIGYVMKHVKEMEVKEDIAEEIGLSSLFVLAPIWY